MREYLLSEVETLARQGKLNEAITVVDSGELFPPERRRRTDSYNYIYVDPRVKVIDYELTEDCTLIHPPVYIGRGTGSRVIDHLPTSDETKKLTNQHLSRWIDKMRSEGIEPRVVFYCNKMNKAQSEDLEADLIDRAMRLQDPITGIAAFTAATSPLRLFNRRREKADCPCYDVDGKRIPV